MDIKATIVFEKNYNELFNGTKRFLVNEGGSRSSKTYSLCQLIIIYCLLNKNKVISIVRKTFPTLRATVMRDFFDVMKSMNLYERNNHNKTENIYTFNNGTIVEFFSTDDEQKIRGRKRDLCWANEANELFYEDYLQLNMRTSGKFIIDYNPSDASSWCYDLLTEDKVLIKSTYKDNPFIEKDIVKQLELLQKTDEALWSVYGLGERVQSRKNVYQGWNIVKEKPDYFTEYIYGLDFGYNHPTALVKVWFNENNLFLETIIYESYLTTTDLISRLNDLNIDKNKEIMADYARPEIIQELKLANYNVHNAKKEVKKGIDNVKGYNIYLYDTDKNLIKEYENYQWKKVGERITDEPVKLWDDALDAMRYAVFFIKDNYGEIQPLISF